MRSSKSRSRSKSNRQRSMGNIVNRVFDSSGPEGKVRGTPQQIIDKYTQLARDAGLGNDRVAAENFQQHAEHYTRMLGEAQREQEARREQQEQQQRDRQRERHENANSGGNNQGGNNQGGNNQGGQQQQRPQSEPEALQSVEPVDSQPDVIEDDLQGAPQPDIVEAAPPASSETSAGGGVAESDSGLVETPENKSKQRRPRSRKPKAEAAEGESPAEEAKPKRPRASRAKPKAQKQDAATDGSTDSPDSHEAAE